MMLPRALFLLFLMGRTALAGLPQAALDDVALIPPPGAHLPLDAELAEASGATTLGSVLKSYPASLVVFADYTCSGVCGTALAIAEASLESPGTADLNVGFVVIGIDPKDGLQDAERMRAALLTSDDAPAGRTRFLVADGPTVSRLTQAMGYEVRYDRERDQFAHPAAALVVTGDGRLVRTLGSLSLNPETLRTALVEAGEGRIGGVFERLTSRCYSFDPVRGVYTADIMFALRLAGIATLLLIAAGLAFLLRRGSRIGGA